MELVLPTIRLRSINGLSSLTQQKIKLVVSSQDEANEVASDETNEMSSEASAGGSQVQKILPQRSENRKRCAQCLESIQGPNQKRKKDTLSKVQQQCQCCGSPLYSKHPFMSCIKCVKQV